MTSSFAVTFFPNFATASKAQNVHTCESLADLIRHTSAPRKDALPWLKLARFGDIRTGNNALRHDANVISITGVEADYDGGIMTLDEAHDTLVKQGLFSILYASPSHNEDTPHWRVLCPLSEEMRPGRRDHMLARLNGLFRGIFAQESWTLSQSYYYGAVAGNPSHRVEVVDGQTIDAHDDLDVTAIGRPATPGTTGEAGHDARKDAELIRGVVTGEHLHVELVALAARYVGRGIPSETVLELLRGVMLSHPEQARDPRWHDRYNDLARTVSSAVTKYQPQVRDSVPDQRRTETAKTAFRLLKAGRDHRDVVQVLQELNRRRRDPLPAETVTATARWAAGKVVEGAGV